MSSKNKTVVIKTIGHDEEKEKKLIREKKIRELKQKLTPLTGKSYYKGHLDVSDANLSRFLDSSDNSVLLAEAKLRASIFTRKRLNPIGLLHGQYKPPYVLKDHMGGGICGFDKEGSPVCYQLFGLTDMLGIIKSCTEEQMETYWAVQFQRYIETVKSLREQEDKQINSMLLVVDMQGCSSSTLQWTALTAWGKALQLHYKMCPGIFKEILLIHPPLSLPHLYTMMAPKLTHRIKERIKIIGDGNVLRHLLLRIEKHELPAYLGGYKCDMNCNPYCFTNITWPEKVPHWAYLTDSRFCANVLQLAISAGDLCHREVMVPAADTRIFWQIYDVSHPFVLEIFEPPQPKPEKPTVKSGVPTNQLHKLLTTRLKVTDAPQGGVVLAPLAGVYTITFDNRKDMVNKVHAILKLTILPPVEFYSKFNRNTTLGESIDFTKPVDEAERQKKREIILACDDCRLSDLTRYF